MICTLRFVLPAVLLHAVALSAVHAASSAPSTPDNLDANQAPSFSDQTLNAGERIELRLSPTAFGLQDTDLRANQSATLAVMDDRTSPSDGAPFSVGIAAAGFSLREGDADGTTIPVSITRDAGYTGSIELSVQARDDADRDLSEASFSPASLDASASTSDLTLVRQIDIQPIQRKQSEFIVTASDGTSSATATVTVTVTPVERDDVYLLIGQSNMVGSSEVGAKQAGPGEPDEPMPRIRQLNVTSNERSNYVRAEDFSNPAINVAEPAIVTAQDPLHDPVEPSTLAKQGTTIGPGLSFAKQALNETTRNIVLVPGAWSATGFCNGTPTDADWNPQPSDNPSLGNTYLFERALLRANEALERTGGILRGILWLQGEADSNDDCAPSYEENLTRMVAELRSTIDVDARGTDARGPDAPIPFVVGTLSRGVDPRGDFSQLNAGAITVDTVHKNFASLTAYGEVSLHDDLIPSNGFPCGSDACVHFGGEAQREIGVRFYDALQRASVNAP